MDVFFFLTFTPFFILNYLFKISHKVIGFKFMYNTIILKIV